MKFNFITFMVRDIDKSIRFYQELAGLQVLKRFHVDKGEIAFLANAQGETMLELIAFDGAEKVFTKGMVMSFSMCDDLSKLRAKTAELGYHPSEIMNSGPKPEHFTVPDPDGILVEFTV